MARFKRGRRRGSRKAKSIPVAVAAPLAFIGADIFKLGSAGDWKSVGYVMTGVFLYLFFVPYRRLRTAVRAEDWPAGALALTRIRQLVGLNLLLGLANVASVYLLPLLG
jgi:hypothetical protein